MPKKEDNKKRVKVEVVEETGNGKDEVVEKKTLDDKKDTEEIKKEKELTEEKEEKPKDESKEESSEEKLPETDKLPFWILFFAFLIGLTLGAGLIGGIFYYKSRVESSVSDESKPSSTIAPDTEEEKTEDATEPEIELSSYSIQILNGSGIKGIASEFEVIIQDAGFDNTTTGNADNYEYEVTEVSFKTSVSQEVKDVINDSLSDYETETNDDLSDTSEYDVVIIVGSSQ